MHDNPHLLFKISSEESGSNMDTAVVVVPTTTTKIKLEWEPNFSPCFVLGGGIKDKNGSRRALLKPEINQKQLIKRHPF